MTDSCFLVSVSFVHPASREPVDDTAKYGERVLLKLGAHELGLEFGVTACRDIKLLCAVVVCQSVEDVF